MNRRDLSRLKTLKEEEPAKLIRLIRLLWPDIRAAIYRGHTLKLIHSRLAEIGIFIGYHQFVVYVNRLRKEDTKHQSEAGATLPEKMAPGPAASNDIASSEQDSSGRDPLANIRERLVQNRPGFNFDDGRPDKRKLVG